MTTHSSGHQRHMTILTPFPCVPQLHEKRGVLGRQLMTQELEGVKATPEAEHPCNPVPAVPSAHPFPHSYDLSLCITLSICIHLPNSPALQRKAQIVELYWETGNRDRLADISRRKSKSCNRFFARGKKLCWEITWHHQDAAR